MHAFMIAGSRNAEGKTARCAKAIAEGLTEAGATSELVFLPALNLERCRQCDPDGWGICRREGRCIIEDDFASLVEKLKAADVAILATQVYYKDLSESMKAFLDRLRRISSRQEDRPLCGKPAVGVCLAGGGGNGAPSACLNLEYFLYMIGFNVVDMIPVRGQDIDKNILVLEMTGRWLASQTNVRKSTWGVRLGIITRRAVTVLLYLVYFWLGRWRHKSV